MYSLVQCLYATVAEPLVVSKPQLPKCAKVGTGCQGAKAAWSKIRPVQVQGLQSLPAPCGQCFGPCVTQENLVKPQLLQLFNTWGACQRLDASRPQIIFPKIQFA